jgi:arylsulfatase A-like enzyme
MPSLSARDIERNLAVLIVFLSSLLVHHGCAGVATEGPHVIVISLDTTRADHLGCYGNAWIRTPNLDALADESILFTNFMTVVTTTLPAQTSLFTGKYPHTHGTPRNGFMVNRDNVMLAEVLKDAGFHTAGFPGSFALDSRFDFNLGFDHYDENYDILVGTGGVEQAQRSAAALTDAVIGYLEKMAVYSRMFLFVHYFDPHAPYAPPPPFDKMYGPEGETDVPETGLEIRGDEGSLNVRAMRRLYAGEVSYMDEHVGRLLKYLSHRGILDESLLIVTSDHGENLGEHQGYFDHGWTTFETELSAVCMIRLPGAVHGGTKVEPLAAIIDVMPTVLSFLKLELPEGMEGEMLDLSIPSHIATSNRRYGEATKPHQGLETNPLWHNLRKQQCIRDGDYKYVVTPFQRTEALFNVVADPEERVNLLLSPSPAVKLQAATLRRLLGHWGNSAKPLPSHFEETQFEETVEKLKALGYLQ